VSLLAWSFAKARLFDSQLFDVLGQRAVEVLPRMAPNNISNLAWAYGQLGLQHPALFPAMSAAVQVPGALDKYSGQNLTDTLWGFSSAGYTVRGMVSTAVDCD
jgi:hypothetical protein